MNSGGTGPEPGTEQASGPSTSPGSGNVANMIGALATEPGVELAPHRSLAAPPATGRTGQWTGERVLRALLMLALAAGLVLMHHVVGAHQHAPDQPAAQPAGPAAAHGSSAHSPPAGAPVALDASARVPGTEATALQHSSAAALHVHHDQAGHDDMAAALHLCLAVLAAAFALALLHLATGRRFDLERERPARTPRRPHRGRPPLPVPLRLAHLQILRL